VNDEVGARFVRSEAADPQERQLRADDAGGAKIPAQARGAHGDDDRVPPALLFLVQITGRADPGGGHGSVTGGYASKTRWTFSPNRFPRNRS